ncbi:MAG: hypothetical protein CSA75_00720 [Sorangium cellulosum]|nr:MAG: hypothetical protein CSA75_00720 [Sorangium cellulosum]
MTHGSKVLLEFDESRWARAGGLVSAKMVDRKRTRARDVAWKRARVHDRCKLGTTTKLITIWTWMEAERQRLVLWNEANHSLA